MGERLVGPVSPGPSWSAVRRAPDGAPDRPLRVSGVLRAATGSYATATSTGVPTAFWPRRAPASRAPAGSLPRSPTGAAVMQRAARRRDPDAPATPASRAPGSPAEGLVAGRPGTTSRLLPELPAPGGP